MRKETKATKIPEKVKKAVWARDGGRIPRSQGGLGIEQNIVTLCDSCHMAFDQSPKRKSLREYIRRYLKMKYPDWDETKLIYKKGT